MDKNDLIIRRASRAEIDLMVDWAAEEGWNPGLHDAECFYNTDPDGFFIGLVKDKTVCCISAVKYDASFGFIGFYIVKNSHRGKGYGFLLSEAGLSYLKGCVIGVDGVVAQQENYKKRGLKLAFRNFRFETTGGGSGSENCVELNQVPFDDIVEYDKALFMVSRPGFLVNWIRQPGTSALGVIKDNRLSGYGVIRPCRKGFKIGPLFADDPTIAAELFASLAARAPGEPVFLDIPEANTAALELSKRQKMAKMFETARMYSGSFALPVDRVYGITSFELG